MLEPTVRGFDPRAFLKGQAPVAERSASRGRVAVAVAAVVTFTAFGSIVVRAGDDSGVYAFVKQQVRAVQPRAAQPQQPAAVAYPAQFRTAGDARRAERAFGQPRQAAILTSYAPFASPFFPLGDEGRRLPDGNRTLGRIEYRRPADRQRARSAAGPAAQGGSRVAYCVRTCDGFYFPVPVSGDDRQLETACNRMCPTAETKVYFGAVGQDIDTARAAAQGKRYANLSQAFSYRRAIDRSCACTADGYGMAPIVPIDRDSTLRAGDIVMTARGLQVFNGGAMPYRGGSFTRIERSTRISGRVRTELLAIDAASSRGLPAVVAEGRPRAPSVSQRREAELRAALMSPRRDTPAATVARVILPSPITAIR